MMYGGGRCLLFVGFICVVCAVSAACCSLRLLCCTLLAVRYVLSVDCCLLPEVRCL